MKTCRLIFAALLLFGVSLAAFSSASAKTNNNLGTSKKHHHKKPVFQYYLVFTIGSDTYEVHGTGGQFSGTLNWGYEACIAHRLYIGSPPTPTATGTYSYNTTTGVMSINCTGVNFGTGSVTYSGMVSYDSSPIPLTCN